MRIAKHAGPMPLPGTRKARGERHMKALERTGFGKETPDLIGLPWATAVPSQYAACDHGGTGKHRA